MSVGIEGLKASIKAVDDMVDTIGAIMEDGKIGIADLMKLPALFGEVKALVAASAQVQAEIGDLDVAEAQELLGAVLAIVAKVASKFK